MAGIVNRCEHCKRPFFAELETCPHCHRELLRWKLLKVGVVVVFIIALMVAYFCLEAEQ